MKLIQTLKNHLPVSRKAHQAALAKARHQADMDNSWMLNQLKQVTAANIRLERKLATSQDAATQVASGEAE